VDQRHVFSIEVDRQKGVEQFRSGERLGGAETIGTS
jgi:hypothetical protein